VYPEETEEDPAGMYVLKSLPPMDRTFVPQDFIPQSREVFDGTLKKVIDFYQATQPEVVNQWREFSRSIPANNSAIDHLRDNPTSMRIPLKDLLFLNGDTDNSQAVADFHNKKRKQSEMVTVRSTDSVAWSRRGKKLCDDDPNSKLRVAIDCPPANYVSKNKKLAKQKNPRRRNNEKNKSNKKGNNRLQSQKFRSNSSDEGSSDSSSSSNSCEDCEDSSDDDENDESEEDDDEDQQSETQYVGDDEDLIAYSSSPGYYNHTTQIIQTDSSGGTTSHPYDTDDERIDKASYVHKRTNIQVPRYGNSLLYIDKKFVIQSTKNGDDSVTEHGTIVAVVCPADNPNSELFFKVYNQTVFPVRPSAYDDESAWKYIPCVELMKATNKSLKWEGGKPAGLGDSLVGMMVRRPFKINKKQKFFNGRVMEYLKAKNYKVLYEDGDERHETQEIVVKYLMYTF
jgi:hypothetical protein